MNDNTLPPSAFVVFCGRADLWWLKFLRPGFRHCFALLNDGRHWIAVDPLLCFTDVAVLPIPAYADLPAWYSKRGFTVVETKVNRSVRKLQPLGIFTCVEAVKRVLGVFAPTIFTPWQLYRFLTKDRKGQKLPKTQKKSKNQSVRKNKNKGV